MRELFGTEPGFIGPIGGRVPVLADEALQGQRGLVHRGGLRADIVGAGRIAVGDEVTVGGDT